MGYNMLASRIARDIDTSHVSYVEDRDKGRKLVWQHGCFETMIRAGKGSLSTEGGWMRRNWRREEDCKLCGNRAQTL